MADTDEIGTADLASGADGAAVDDNAGDRRWGGRETHIELATGQLVTEDGRPVGQAVGLGRTKTKND